MTPGTDEPLGRAFSLEEALTALVADNGLLGVAWPAVAPPDAADRAAPPTLLLDGAQLAALQARLRDDDEAAGALRSLVRAAAETPIESVTDKAVAGPSGDLRDYVSLARYWWPEEGQPDGLPYVRRDGEVNPECGSDLFDSGRLARFSETVLVLALGGYLLDEPRWSEAARKRLTVWLLDPLTRQNPAFDFAQLVRGQDWVRPPAVVDARRMLAVAESFRLLQWQAVLSAEETAGILEWFGSLLSWLTRSPAAQAAAGARNNVAVWCLLERCALADLLGDEVVLSTSLADAGEILAAQVEVDGSLPAELARENPADYTAFAFVAMAQLARLGELREVPLWERAAADGRGLSATRDWLAAVASSDASAANAPDAQGLAMRLLTWREEALRSVSLRADRLTDELGRRDRDVARLSARLDRLREEVGSNGRSGPVVPRSTTSSAREALSSVRDRAPAWPVVGPAGRQAKRAVRAYRRGRSGAPPRAAAQGVSPAVESQLAREYRQSALAGRPTTFVLYRILGNDLPPRHMAGQTLANVRFILEHEPDLEDCDKRWVLNRIVDAHTERALIDLLGEHAQPVLRLPFCSDVYAREPFELDELPRPDYLTTEAWDRSFPDRRARAVSAAYRHKNIYAMNNNGARNAAIEDGRARATWILPFDGSTFVTADAWRSIREAVLAKPHVPYVVVPMVRVVDNADVLSGGPLPPASDEPQLAFRADARERFDESRPYGRRSKVDLLWRLGVPGPWEGWPRDPWDPPYPAASPDHGCFQSAGLAVRLATGSAHRDMPGSSGLRERGAIREEAIVSFLRGLDAAQTAAAWVPQELAFYDDGLLERIAVDGVLPSTRAAIVAEAQAALLRGPFAVTDKTTLPPSGNPHDYWHPAPYWWPNPSRPEGLPYVRRDGRRLPGTEMFSAQSGQFDRARLHLTFSDVTALALGWRITGEVGYAQHAARQIRAWFLDADTAMTPNLDYAQVRRGHDGDRGQASGIIEFKDVYYFLDAVRLVRRSGCLTAEESGRLDAWLDAYVDWLLASRQGIEERFAANNHGTCYDLQAMAISAYLGRATDFADAALRATGRLHAHFDPLGRQPEELARTETRHYCAFNLQSWANLARVAEAGGCDLWREPDGAVGPLGPGIDWYLAMQADDGWPFPQGHPFDPRRDAVIDATGRLLREPGLSLLAVAEDVAATTASSVMHAHDGAAPFWLLALGPRRTR